MKIAVIGASGKIGRLITQEALARGHQVTAIVRDPNAKVDSQAVVMVRDLFDLTDKDLSDQDVVISAFAAWAPEALAQHQTSLQHLANLLSGKTNRLLVVGGAGSLYIDPTHTIRVMDTPDFPDAYKPVATNMAKGFDELRTRNDVKWTYISPSANFVADGVRTGHYTAGGEELMVNSQGESEISYADYAIAMVDEAEIAKHVQQRFTVVSK